MIPAVFDYHCAGSVAEAIALLDDHGDDAKRPSTQFFVGFLETAVAPDEILIEIRVPKVRGGRSFQKFNRRAQDWMIVGVAAVGGPSPSVELVNMGPRPHRATAVEEALAGGASVSQAAAHAADCLDTRRDLNAGAAYRRHLATVLSRRALEETTAAGG